MSHQYEEKTNLENVVKMMSKDLNVWLTIRNLNVNDYARIKKCERMQTLKRKKLALQFLFCSIFHVFSSFCKCFQGTSISVSLQVSKKER